MCEFRFEDETSGNSIKEFDLLRTKMILNFEKDDVEKKKDSNLLFATDTSTIFGCAQ